MKTSEAMKELENQPTLVFETKDHGSVLFYDEESKIIMLGRADINSDWKLKEED